MTLLTDFRDVIVALLAIAALLALHDCMMADRTPAPLRTMVAR